MADDASPAPAPAAESDRWSAEDGRNLRALREKAGLDRGLLARRCTLSPTQLQQLEDGGDSAFYSASIKLAAGVRAIDRLGGSRPPRPAAMVPPTDAPTAADSGLPAAVPAPTLPCPPATSALEHPAATPAAAAAPPAVARPADAPPTQAAEAAVQPAPVQLAPAPPRAPAGAMPDPVAARPSRWVGHGRAWMALALAAGILGLAVTARMGPPQAERTAVAHGEPPATSRDPPPPTSPPEPKAATAAAPGPDTAAPAALQPASPSPAAGAATAGEGRSARDLAREPASGADSKVPVAPEGCARGNALPVVEATPPSADRSPDYVYLVAREALTLCLQDAGQPARLLTLQPDKGLRVDGIPPFLLWGPALPQVDVYFQGNRIRAHQGGDAVALRLLPR